MARVIRWAAALVLAGCGMALAAGPIPSGIGSLDSALRHCATLHADMERLHCFDALAAGLPAIESDRFGLTADIKRKRDPVAVQQEATATLESHIAGLTRSPYGVYVFTLDNQQVWREVEARASIEFAVGESVRIEHGALGSLWLRADSHRAVRVRRVR